MKAIVSLSGGMDSATCLALALSEGREAFAVRFIYGSKHSFWEGEAAAKVATHYNVPLHEIELVDAFRCFNSNLLLSGGPIPEGHYEDETMKQTVVPARNAIFTTILGGLAASIGAKEIWLGVHAGDHAIYPDCRPLFVDYMQHTLRLALGDNAVNIRTPLLYQNKAWILRRGVNLTPPVPYHLTRTCYKDQQYACGKCGSCSERLEAFKSLDLADPIPYATA